MDDFTDMVFALQSDDQATKRQTLKSFQQQPEVYVPLILQKLPYQNQQTVLLLVNILQNLSMEHISLEKLEQLIALETNHEIAQKLQELSQKVKKSKSHHPSTPVAISPPRVGMKLIAIYLFLICSCFIPSILYGFFVPTSFQKYQMGQMGFCLISYGLIAFFFWWQKSQTLLLSFLHFQDNSLPLSKQDWIKTSITIVALWIIVHDIPAWSTVFFPYPIRAAHIQPSSSAIGLFFKLSLSVSCIKFAPQITQKITYQP
jgi:hypothetical protein